MSEKIIKAGVIGWPVEHSLSPIIHQHWLKENNINGSYEAIPVRPEELGDKLKDLAKKGYAGVNVTIPHKEKVLEYLDKPDDSVKIIGAANTLEFFNGEIIGSNTDWIGFEESLKRNGNWQTTKAKIVVIGAGGAARAAAKALLTPLLMYQATEIVLLNRTIEKAQKIKEDLSAWFGHAKNIKIEKWENRNLALKDAHVLVNTTSLGMIGQPELDIDLAELPKNALVYDLVYNPMETGLLKKAKARGNQILNGLDMLIYQAVPGFYKWFGKEPEITPELRLLLTTELEKQCQ